MGAWLQKAEPCSQVEPHRWSASRRRRGTYALLAVSMAMIAGCAGYPNDPWMVRLPDGSKVEVMPENVVRYSCDNHPLACRSVAGGGRLQTRACECAALPNVEVK